MKIITTPMCEDVLKIAGLDNYTVVKPSEIKNADVAILLSETQSDIPKISVKLNTFTQVYESVLKIQKEFDTTINQSQVDVIKNYIDINNEKKDNRKNTKVKVYSNFLRDTLIDMGFTIDDADYECIVVPDYWNNDIDEDKKVITVPSHKNVSRSIIERVKERYDLLEREICTKQ
ncbi:MAG: hypothetical protein BZ135_03500 [Methanosphaera sp. rholeuAM6]|nr:MAG: hypothetical protein BZ135_03500 [Methanosphaera sp. rholeuAM6]